MTLASTVVAVATLASIAFAVVTYMESTVLTKRIEDGNKKAEQCKEQALREFQAVRRQYFRMALDSLKGLLRVFMSLEPGPAYKNAVGELLMTEVALNLDYGSYSTLLKAIQAAYKHDKRLFLNIEATIWDKSERLDKAKKEAVRKEYQQLKKKALFSLERRIAT